MNMFCADVLCKGGIAELRQNFDHPCNREIKGQTLGSAPTNNQPHTQIPIETMDMPTGQGSPRHTEIQT